MWPPAFLPKPHITIVAAHDNWAPSPFNHWPTPQEYIKGPNTLWIEGLSPAGQVPLREWGWVVSWPQEPQKQTTLYILSIKEKNNHLYSVMYIFTLWITSIIGCHVWLSSWWWICFVWLTWRGWCWSAVSIMLLQRGAPSGPPSSRASLGSGGRVIPGTATGLAGMASHCHHSLAPFLLSLQYDGLFVVVLHLGDIYGHIRMGAHSWWFYSAVQMGDQAAATMTDIRHIILTLC